MCVLLCNSLKAKRLSESNFVSISNKALKVKCACCSQPTGYFEIIMEHFFSAYCFPSNLFLVSRDECQGGMLTPDI